MKRYQRLVSFAAVIGMLFGIAVLGTSCMPEMFVTPLPETRNSIVTTLVTVEIENPTEEADVTTEPETLPGNDTLAPGCAHRYGDWIVAIQPQCEETGMKYRLCADCNGRQEEAIAATGHTEEAMVDIPATCSLQGEEGGTYCTVCKETIKEPTPVPVIEHSYQSGGICTSCGALENGADGLAYLDLYNQSYGYDYLGTMGKGDSRQQLYRTINEASRQFHTDPSLEGEKELKDYDPVVCKINYADLGLTVDEAYSVWKTFRDDNPLYYWLSNMAASDAKTLYVLIDPNYASGVVRMETNSRLYQKISGYLAILPADATDYQIALLIHDKMIASIDYALDAGGQPQTEAWAHTILGVFDARGAVCEGFARAYQLLLNFKGVECLLVTGESRGQGHAWNMIELDGEWFGVDVTWDDNKESSDPYSYFCLSDSEFYQSHVLDLPTDTSVHFLYAVPTLSAYSIEWVELYQGTTLLGRYTCIDRAFEAMTDSEAAYTVQLLDGKDDELLHDVNRFHVYGDLPEVETLTLIGRHTIIHSGFLSQSYTATEICLDRSVTMNGDLILKSVFLMSEKSVTISKNGHVLTEGDYGKVRNYVSAIA